MLTYTDRYWLTRTFRVRIRSRQKANRVGPTRSLKDWKLPAKARGTYISFAPVPWYQRANLEVDDGLSISLWRSVKDGWCIDGKVDKYLPADKIDQDRSTTQQVPREQRPLHGMEYS
jgi:hypothetical protein